MHRVANRKTSSPSAASALMRALNAEAKIVVLDVDDNYLKGDPELMRILKEKLSGYFGIL